MASASIMHYHLLADNTLSTLQHTTKLEHSTLTSAPSVTEPSSFHTIKTSLYNSNAMAPKKMKKPKKAKRKSGTGGPFICPLCNKGFSRRATVKEPHFGTCVARLGNPHRLPWDAHQSCWAKRPGRRPGPSGTAAPGVERILAEDKDKEEEEEEEEEDGDEDMQSEANEIEGEHNVWSFSCA